jgi:quercetin dioxygenase-like cupin family protein
MFFGLDLSFYLIELERKNNPMDTMKTQTLLLHQETPDEMQELIRLYAMNSPFRSATAEELIVTDNPYRRPIRPPDLDFIDYRQPLTADKILKLSALMGHRMLRNIYETELSFLPGDKNSPAWQDFELFYSPENIKLGELVRPHLEKHVFNFLNEESATRESFSVAPLKEQVVTAGAEAKARINQTVDTILHADDRPRIMKTFLIQQLSAYRAERETLTRSLIGEYDGVWAHVSRFFSSPSTIQDTPAADRSSLLKRLVKSCGLHIEPHAYWQFYLSTSLALANYMYHVSRDPGKIFRAIGARAYREIYHACCRDQIAEAIRSIYGDHVDTAYYSGPAPTPEQIIETVIVPLAETYGEHAIGEISRGFYENMRLHEIADSDFITQVTWADKPTVYEERARIMFKAIQDQNLQVPLDTFVELSSETSTTHTHDEHRLLVIETGEMHFWTLSGPPMHLRPGDMTYIPYERLHGSTVISNECIYHQPVISPELLHEFEKLFP